MTEANLDALVGTVSTESEIYLSSVKACKRDTLIKAGEIAKISCHVNTGFFTRDTPVVFENGIICPLPPGLDISESLLNLERGNRSEIDLVRQNTSAHDIELTGRTLIRSIHLIRSVMPVAVKLQEENNEITRQSQQEVENSAAGHNDTDYNEALVPNVP